MQYKLVKYKIMAITLEIGYYNTFILSGGASTGDWHVEESRIKGGFNDKTVDFGVRAYVVDEEYETRTRENGLIHSGIYNSKTKVNNTNQFPIGDDITRAVDIANGSIQKLHAEDTDLIILQENKVMKAAMDKDVIFTAEGQPISALSNVVIGNIRPILGKFGISKNPESFATFGGRKYFTDKNRGVVLRLSQDGLTPISQYGMKDFFRDNLEKATTIYGMYDEVKDAYVLSMQGSSITGGKSTDNNVAIVTSSGYLTLSYSEKSTGWVSLFSYKPTFGTSLSNKFYTFNKHNLFKHYDPSTQRNNFYNSTYKDPSYVDVVMNDQPSVIKNFLTINYEGSSGWSMESAKSRSRDNSTSGASYTAIAEEAYKIPKKGVTINDESYLSVNVGFDEKENKYFKQLNNKNINMFNDNTYFSSTGLKGEYLEINMQYWEPTFINNEAKAELFAVSNETKQSSN